jgi:hypothetical protein
MQSIMPRFSDSEPLADAVIFTKEWLLATLLPFNLGLWPDRYIHSGQSLALQSDTSFREPPEQSRHLALMTFKGLIDILPDGRLPNLRACEGQLSDGHSLTS